jgi:hypothetical protein
MDVVVGEKWYEEVNAQRV